jgi:exopolysaccharide biosynthesis protein
MVYLGFERDIPGVRQVVGGAGRILAAGRNVSDSMAAVEGIKSSFTDVRHPRTFVAINKDSTRIFVCTVDGRQASSVGMTFDEMADFLRNIGAWDGINLDGGGSTTMVVRGVVVNSPSDASGERPVANSLHVIAPDFPPR